MAAPATGGASAPKASSRVKLVLLGEAAVGKVRPITISTLFVLPHLPDRIARCQLCRATPGVLM
jgi:hypothetical protein